MISTNGITQSIRVLLNVTVHQRPEAEKVAQHLDNLIPERLGVVLAAGRAGNCSDVVDLAADLANVSLDSSAVPLP